MIRQQPHAGLDHAQSQTALDPKNPARVGVGGRLVGTVSGLIVLAVLCGTAYWGHRTDWRFVPSRHESPVEGHAQRDATLAVVRFGPIDPSARGLPPALQASATISFDSPEAVEKAGVDIAAAWTSAMTETISASGELRFDPSRMGRLSTRVPGTAARVIKTVGDTVKTGDVLALIDAAEVGKAKSEFEQALVQTRLKQNALANLSSAGNAVSERQRREAEAAAREAEVHLLSAEQALVNLGLPLRVSDYRGLAVEEIVRRMRSLGIADADAAGSAGHTGSANLLPVRSSLDGVVLTAAVVAGEVVEAGRVLFVVVDPRQLWLTLHVGQDDARRVMLGQTVRFRPDGLSDEVSGKVAWVGTSADETTRRVPVRVELTNTDGRLRASTLGFGRIVVREEPNAVVVPKDAVLTVQGTQVVFVRDPDFLKPNGSKAFHIRVVRTGAHDGQNTEIIAGLKPGDVVAGKGTSVLLNEWRRAASAFTVNR